MTTDSGWPATPLQRSALVGLTICAVVAYVLLLVFLPWLILISAVLVFALLVGDPVVRYVRTGSAYKR